MPDPANIKFFREHKEDIDKMVRAENVRRSRRQIEPLNDDEIDDAISEMKSLVAEGKRLRAYQFPTKNEPQRPPEPPRNPKLADVIPRQPGAIPVSPRRVPADPNAYQFEVVMCANGFVIHVAKNGVIEPFIFKTEEDLMGIFRETLFDELKRMKERKTNEQKKPENQSGAGVDAASMPGNAPSGQKVPMGLVPHNGNKNEPKKQEVRAIHDPHGGKKENQKGQINEHPVITKKLSEHPGQNAGRRIQETTLKAQNSSPPASNTGEHEQDGAVVR